MDRGNGQPDVIVADVHATAEMLAWSRANVDDVSNRFHRANLLLYYDEPNMGIHLDERTLQICKTIMWDAPYLTVLASATIDPWGKLPAWWKGRCEPAQRCVITQEPYELPSVLSRRGVLARVASAVPLAAVAPCVSPTVQAAAHLCWLPPLLFLKRNNLTGNPHRVQS